MTKGQDILKHYWGYDSFRPLQEEIVDSAIYGHDTFAILPTGGGKSICFQVPGIAREGVTIVVSPLIALMQDQVNNLESKGIKATAVTSSMSYREIDIALDNVRFGHTKFLYTSPERLNTPLFIERFKQMSVGLIVVDEAHCISEWGHDFRPSYREIANLRLHHPNCPIIAVTASATEEVQKDIIEQLNLHKVQIFKGSVERDNIIYESRGVENKLKEVIDYISQRKTETGIVYCSTRRSVKEIVQQLRAHNISAGMYHGGMNAEDRKYMLELWLKGSLTVMVATNAFGMGIDKPNVRFVLHYEVPNNLEAYYQEAGRAGRDGLMASAIAYWENDDLEKYEEQLKAKYPPIERIKQIYNAIFNHFQIAIGAGEKERFNLDINKFSHQFNLDIKEVYHALKILELNGDFHFEERNYFPTRLQIIIGNSALYKFQVAHERTAPLITLLSRSYPGIFDRYARIHEAEITKRLGISNSELKRLFEFLESNGVIDIEYSSNLPKLTILRPRATEQNLSISSQVYANRKNVEFKKLEAIKEYLTTDNCRSEMILAYFGSATKKCKKCDICRQELSSNYSISELKEAIIELLPSTISKISQTLDVEQIHVQNALHKLMLDEKANYADGMFYKS